MDIKNKVVIITGASSGIGLATAKYLSVLGARVVIAARSKDKLKELEKELPDSLAVITDMRKTKDIENLIKKTVDRYGRIDVLINNAGQGVLGSVESIDMEQYQQIMELNVYGVVRAMQAVIPYMREQGGGMIVNISSAVTKTHIPGLSAYSSTKYALNSISLTARQELEKEKIIVSIILPKGTVTNFMKNALGSNPYWEAGTQMSGDSPEKVAKKIAEIIKTGEAELSV